MQDLMQIAHPGPSLSGAAHISDDCLRPRLNLKLLDPDHLSVAALELVIGLESAVERSLQTSRCRSQPQCASLWAAAVDPT